MGKTLPIILIQIHKHIKSLVIIITCAQQLFKLAVTTMTLCVNKRKESNILQRILIRHKHSVPVTKTQTFLELKMLIQPQFKQARTFKPKISKFDSLTLSGAVYSQILTLHLLNQQSFQPALRKRIVATLLVVQSSRTLVARILVESHLVPRLFSAHTSLISREALNRTKSPLQTLIQPNTKSFKE